jgi:hypothetical protein
MARRQACSVLPSPGIAAIARAAASSGVIGYDQD